ncbi:facilitated trehalose transporter Tret1-2 homolog [Diorhabda sublineata]|uniref:facilitated trehalose transporter Tret1-2 homolog n=1 Tax=Diorhabda sublineata TaxID=1163346 RepID=UPI0024E18652|nr:facilitated trehalose transporter Tret1-2 homolog [Diorhabda sublineata]
MKSKSLNYAYVVVLTGNIISFVAGTVLTWSSPVLDRLGNETTTPFDHPVTLEERSWISSFFPLGAIFGPFIFGYLSDKIGRKKTLLISGIPFIVSYYSLAFGRHVPVYYAARFVLGAALGGVYTVIPMYVGEVADNSNRGTLGSTMNCLLCLGIFFSYCLGPFVGLTVFNIVLGTVPVLFLVLFSLTAPESPIYLIDKDYHNEAKDCLRKIRGPAANINLEIEMIRMKKEEDGDGGFRDIFKSRNLTKALIITVGLVVFQQFSGVIAVFFYAQTIFEQAGSSLEPAVCSIIIGTVQFVTSFITPVLVDRWGRKLLLLVSAVGMAVSEIILGAYCVLKDNKYDVSNISFLPIVCLVTYILMYNCGYGPLPWVIMGEIFPPNIKSSASSITAAVCWMAGFVTGKYFESLVVGVGIGISFFIFSGFCLAAIPFGIFFVVETKGKTVLEIQKALG